MRYLKLFEEVRDVNIGVDLTKIDPFWNHSDSDEDIEKKYLIALGKKGELIKHLKKDTTQITFGMLKDIWHDALEYKKKREYIKGGYKFLHRAVPMALGPIMFPVWLIGKILGTTRAINKIIRPVIEVHYHNYNNFLVNLITKTMSVMEGDIRYVLGRDWYYDVFYMNWGLINMVRKEHLLEFAKHMSDKMEKQPDDKLVPRLYMENQFRMWLNNKFNLHPPLQLKRVFSNPKRKNN